MSSDTLSGGTTLADVGAQLQEIAKTVSKLTAPETQVRTGNTFADAVRVSGECPSGLVGCNAKELYEKTGGEVTCPPLESAPDPLIVDYKGRICYAPEDIKKQFVGKDLNIDRLVSEYSQKLATMLAKSGNLQKAIETATSGNKVSPIILNYYRSNQYVASFVQAYNLDEGLFIAALNKFTNYLDANTGADLLQSVTSTEILGRATHYDLLVGIFAFCFLFSKESTKFKKFAEIVNALAFCFPLGEIATAPQSDANAATAVAFLPKSFKDFADGFSQQGNAQNIKVQFMNCFTTCLALSAKEALQPAAESQFLTSLKSLRVAFDNMRKYREATVQLLQKKADGGQVLSDEETRAIQNKTGADQNYIVASIDVARAVAKMYSTELSANPAPNGQRYTDNAVRLVQSIQGVNITVIDQCANVLRVQGNPSALIQTAFALSRTNATLTTLEDPYISKAMFKTPEAFLPLVKKQDTDVVTEDSSLTPDQICKVMTASGPVFIKKIDRGVSPQSKASANAKITAAKQYLRTAEIASFVATFAGVSQGEFDAIIAQNCMPIDSGEFNTARKIKILGSSGVDMLFQKLVRLDIARATSSMGLDRAERDAYSSLLIILHAFGEPEYLAQLLMNTPLPSLQAAISRRHFASVGPRLGGGENDILEAGEDFDGNWEMLADRLLEGGARTAHVMPETVYEAAGEHLGPAPSKMKKALDSLEAKGLKIATVYDSKCPTYLRDYNNNFGTPGSQKWVETKNPWVKCQEQMGIQFISEKGYCYPYGMTCYPEDDVRTHTVKAAEAVENWMQLAKIYNAVQQKKYTEWLETERVRIRSDAANSGMTDAEIDAMIREYVPEEFRNIPEFGAVQAMVTISGQVDGMVNEITDSVDVKYRDEIKRILMDSGLLGEQWQDADMQVQREQLNTTVKAITEDAKKCTEASIAASAIVPPESVKSTLAQLKLGLAPLGYTGARGPAELGACEVQSFGLTEAALIPRDVKARIDEAAIKRGAAPDPIVQWWRNYYADKLSKAEESGKKLSDKISPFEGKSGISVPNTDASSLLEKHINQALDSKGRSYLKY